MVKVTLDADTFKALASPTRLGVMRALSERRKTVSELARDLEMNKATIHEHLQLLTASGLVKKRDDEGRKWIYYELTWRGERILHPQETTTFNLLLGISIAAAGGGVAMLGRAMGWWFQEQSLRLSEPMPEAGTAPVGPTMGIAGAGNDTRQVSAYSPDAASDTSTSEQGDPSGTTPATTTGTQSPEPSGTQEPEPSGDPQGGSPPESTGGSQPSGTASPTSTSQPTASSTSAPPTTSEPPQGAPAASTSPAEPVAGGGGAGASIERDEVATREATPAPSPKAEEASDGGFGWLDGGDDTLAILFFALSGLTMFLAVLLRRDLRPKPPAEDAPVFTSDEDGAASEAALAGDEHLSAADESGDEPPSDEQSGQDSLDAGPQDGSDGPTDADAQPSEDGESETRP